MPDGFTPDLLRRTEPVAGHHPLRPFPRVNTALGSTGFRAGCFRAFVGAEQVSHNIWSCCTNDPDSSYPGSALNGAGDRNSPAPRSRAATTPGSRPAAVP